MTQSDRPNDDRDSVHPLFRGAKPPEEHPRIAEIIDKDYEAAREKRSGSAERDPIRGGWIERMDDEAPQAPGKRGR